jgi:hypothetical protein
MSLHSRNALIAAAVALGIGAVAHIVIYLGGPDWIAFVGAPDAAVKSARDGTWLAPLGTFAITALLAGLAVLSLSEAGVLRRHPLTRIPLWLFAAIFVLRGLIVAPALVAGKVNWSAPVDVFIVVSSAFILLIGLLLTSGLGLRRTRSMLSTPGHLTET